MLTLRSFFSALSALLVLAANAYADDPVYFLLDAQALSCLKENAARYAPEGDEMSFITVADCGSEKAQSIKYQDQAQNFAPDLDISTQDGADLVVAFSAQDFTCLQNLNIPNQDGLLAFYPGACNVEPRN
jgi:hypothetical protein